MTIAFIFLSTLGCEYPFSTSPSCFLLFLQPQQLLGGDLLSPHLNGTSLIRAYRMSKLRRQHQSSRFEATPHKEAACCL